MYKLTGRTVLPVILSHGSIASPVTTTMTTKITNILNAAAQGDRRAAAELLPLVYDELRRLAAAKLSREAAGQTLQGTALVHEAYLRLVGEEDQKRWDGRGHFFAAAGEAMRRILVDNARRKQRAKHGGKLRRVELDAFEPATVAPDERLLALDDALTRLEAESPKKAQLVKLRHFVGMTIPEAAEALGISHATAERHWQLARLWLFDALTESEKNSAAT